MDRLAHELSAEPHFKSETPVDERIVLEPERSAQGLPVLPADWDDKEDAVHDVSYAGV